MGTLVKRTDSKGHTTYQAKVRRAGHPVLSKTFPSREMAEAWINERELAIYQGCTAPARSTASVGDVVQRYLQEVTPTKRGSDTERFHIRAIQNSPIIQYTVATLTGQAVRQWRDARLKVVAPATVNRQLGLLHAILEFARKEWGISGGVNPVSDVSRPSQPPSRDRRLSQDEEHALLLACDEARGGYLRDIVELAIETSMRQGELVGLDWSQVDFPRRTIRLQEGSTKNGEGRGVPLSQRALVVLGRRLPAIQKGPVFPGLTSEALKRSFIRARDRAGLENLHFHDLRHEATSRFFEKGLNVMEAASVTGHKDLRMLRRYTHLDAGKLAARLD